MTTPNMTTERYDAVDLIRSKRDGLELSADQLAWLVDAYTRGFVGDEQMAAMAMAICGRGMTRAEVRNFTFALAASGQRMSFAGLDKPTADKHSTGGVGDKITLPLVPLVASFGVAVPQLSGRGLGYSGGTLDKLESIHGWRADLSHDEIMGQLQKVGAVVCSAGTHLAPADRKLYALRDVTGTVEAIPLIASSIMAKKIAEGTDALVLDVKFGSGAFIRERERAEELARAMVELGEDAGVLTAALLTDMSTPLGFTIGNANEVRESVEVLAGGGPPDVVALTVALAREMLALAGKPDIDAEGALASGKAMDVWRAMVRAQGGDPDAALPQPRETETVLAGQDGFVQCMDAYSFTVGAWRLGAGRARKGDTIAHAAGVDLYVKPGDAVRKGDPVFTMMTDDTSTLDRAREALQDALGIGPMPPSRRPLIVDRFGA